MISKNHYRNKQMIEIEAFIKVTYDHIKNRCNGHGKAKYKNMEYISRDAFITWSLQQDDLLTLWKAWVRSNGVLALRPTVDRVETIKGYLLDNMRWLTHSKNSSYGGKASNQRRCIHISHQIREELEDNNAG